MNPIDQVGRHIWDETSREVWRECRICLFSFQIYWNMTDAVRDGIWDACYNEGLGPLRVDAINTKSMRDWVRGGSII